MNVPDGLSGKIVVGHGRQSVQEIYEPACQRRVRSAMQTLAMGRPAAVLGAARAAQREDERSEEPDGTQEWLEFEPATAR